MNPSTQGNSSSRLSNTDLEATFGAPAQHRQIPSPVTMPQGTRAESSQAQYQQHDSQSVAAQPIPIPNAVPKTRLLRVTQDGRIFESAAYAPLTTKEAEEIEKMDEKDRAMDERFRRMKQNVMKWEAENGERGKPAKQHKSPMIERPHDGDSSGLEENVRVGNAVMMAKEDRIPKYQKHVMHPFAHQYSHTTATIAYEEGLKKGAEKAREQGEYQKGYEAGLKARQSHR
ncbi:hypothetical protein E0Z10_g9162 [Xylaria hypoxylon]|uniref:Uncharacterized protein n=1 Tax=Xylaria hypoxylon TaxID=37992 RepID=A0A4Z0YPT1_9PEZI|nr:hypothetical protein E0Z10_g9162 [Xylaria hypoxylon]